MAYSRAKQDKLTQSFEQSQFPVLCETCLGDNPFVRMINDGISKECKICQKPFTVFRWKPGQHGRYKKTEICQTCAKSKNVCQTCILDLEYGLPVQVRDTVLGQQNTGAAQSDVNLEWQANIREQQMAQGQGPNSYGKITQKEELMKIRHQDPYFKRNEAHICSFFVKGTCNRGTACPFRHEMPKHDSELAKQNIRDRFYGNNDPVAKKLLNKVGAVTLTPPADQSIKTLFVGSLTRDITEEDLRGVFYSFGEIEAIKVVYDSSCAFVTFAKREGAEQAASTLHNNLAINKGAGKIDLRLNWAKPSEKKEKSDQTNSTTSTTNTTSSVPLQNTNLNFFGLTNPAIGQNQYPSMSATRIGSKTDR